MWKELLRKSGKRYSNLCFITLTVKPLTDSKISKIMFEREYNEE